jgi:signal recognition particle subunit SRP54
MFETLTTRLIHVFDQLRRRGKLSVPDVDAALRDIRLALLEADVQYKVVKILISNVRERALGAEVSRALNPGQQVIKILHEELMAMLGDAARLHLSGPKPRVVMLIGLQGSGKTTVAGKLARLLRSTGERVMLVAGDPYRPAAAEQLQQLGRRLDVPVEYDWQLDPVTLARRAVAKAGNGGYSVVILDTAGRSQLDAKLMDELAAMSAAVSPVEILLVLDAMLGQEALNIAQGFRDHVAITGLVLAKMDGDARGGAAISVRAVTGVPIKFIGVGEKLDALEVYDPRRMSSRILGMGDVIGLIEKAESAFDAQTGQRQAEKLLNGQLSLEDWLQQMKQLRQVGSIGQIMDMLPGQFGQAARQVDGQELERSFAKSEAIIHSMTRQERRDPDILNASRRRRIAAGSGTEVQDVNRLLKQFREAQRMVRVLHRTGGRVLPGMFG